ncbi:Guanyl-specific ribonuclease F1 [Metarhizium acridum CQMa 102]|uniref:ribonuclease T1 n=1 Tax=Metarhizium acridum (strain CQMa 102) TaxID=655827 RepID=E9DVX9_METAQ|nr:Guanyl-specific ribonuclease F1 [Metarhizium acridum CQMa 102]EFY92176.1 Guanyl-specific ribonuclease F1 [Metarhizium acridum CQMa 102]
MHFSIVGLLSLVALISAAPANLQARDATNCGGVQYTAAAVQAAANAACQYVESGSHAGSSTYPHRYNNYEGFDFPVDGPYNEFPILKSGRIYSGGMSWGRDKYSVRFRLGGYLLTCLTGSPGPDRVVISDGCDLAGVITHTGASGNNFVACSGTS